MKKQTFRQLQVNLNESSLSRLMSRFDSGSFFAILTAYRYSMTPAQNRQRNKELNQVLNSLKMGVHNLIGYWRECQDSSVEYKDCPEDKKVTTVEKSFFVTKPPEMDLEVFTSTIIKLLKKYDQDGAVFGTKGDVKILQKDGTSFQIGTTLAVGKISQGYSKHVKKKDIPFIFESYDMLNEKSVQGRKINRYLINPTANEIKSFYANLPQSKYANQLRCVAYDDTLYVWDASREIHLYFMLDEISGITEKEVTEVIKSGSYVGMIDKRSNFSRYGKDLYKNFKKVIDEYEAMNGNTVVRDGDVYMNELNYGIKR